MAILERDNDVIKEIEVLESKGKNKGQAYEESKKPTEQGPKKIVITEEAKTIVIDLLKEDGERFLEFIRKINEGLCERTEHFAMGNYFYINLYRSY
jgi:hypothetical protein